MESKKVCVVGAGMSGMAFIHHWKQLKNQGIAVPEVVCFEKQSSWGGQWNFNWRSGTDEHGDPVHSSMYHSLFLNSPKEMMEFPDYTFDEHFGKAVPSYLPRDSMLKYLEAYWNKHDLAKYVTFDHSVTDVSYRKDLDNFSVTVREQATDQQLEPMIFDYVVAASGCWSSSNVPAFPGIETFPGEVIHMHDMRSFTRYKDQDVLIIGSSFSAEDACQQLIKFKARRIVVSSRSLPMGYLDKAVEEKPIVTEISGNKVTFQDDTSMTFHTIILATGYRHSFPYLKENPTETGAIPLYSANSYKNMVSLKDGNQKLFHMLLINNFYIVCLSRLQAQWIFMVILGDIKLPPLEEMKADIVKWNDKFKSVLKSVDRKFDLFVHVAEFMLDYKNDVAAAVKPTDDMPMDMKWMEEMINSRVDFVHLREKTFKSFFTDTVSTVPSVPFLDAFFTSDKEFRKLYAN